MRPRWYLAPLLAALAGACVGTATNPGGPDASGALDGGDGRCASDLDCAAVDAGRCEPSTGLCLAETCLTTGCAAGFHCDVAALTCVPASSGPSPLYRGETMLGHGVPQRLDTRDGRGLNALGDFSILTVTRSGRYLYAADNATIVRVDQSTMRAETLSGLGWPGEADGPADVAQFDINFYQEGGFSLTPDERALYVTTRRKIRRVDTTTGEVTTLTPTLPSGFTLRGFAVGASGTLYLGGWGLDFVVLSTDGGVERRRLTLDGGWGNGSGTSPGYLVVDEARGLAYGLDRNYKSGAFYRWPLDGGAVEWLNHQATGKRDPIQYTSDGPVAVLDMANPGGLTIDQHGTVYLGGGDGETFRRFRPDTQQVDSLCHVPDAGDADTRFEWCVGDGMRNKLFWTWPHFLAMDEAGNGYFAYTVWPRLVRLRREP